MSKFKGYKGICTESGRFVEAEEAFDHVLKDCGLTVSDPFATLAQEAKHTLIEWYFSGDWVEVYEDGRN